MAKACIFPSNPPSPSAPDFNGRPINHFFNVENIKNSLKKRSRGREFPASFHKTGVILLLFFKTVNRNYEIFIKFSLWSFIQALLDRSASFQIDPAKNEAGTKILASQLFLDCRARRSG